MKKGKNVVDKELHSTSPYHFGYVSTSWKIEDLFCQIGIRVHQAI